MLVSVLRPDKQYSNQWLLIRYTSKLQIFQAVGTHIPRTCPSGSQWYFLILMYSVGTPSWERGLVIRVLMLRISSFPLRTWKNRGWRRHAWNSLPSVQYFLVVKWTFCCHKCRDFVCKFQKEKRTELSYILLKILVLHICCISLLSPYQLLVLDVTILAQIATAFFFFFERHITLKPSLHHRSPYWVRNMCFLLSVSREDTVLCEETHLALLGRA